METSYKREVFSLKRMASWLLAAVLAVTLCVPFAGAASYTDVPASSSLAGEVEKAVDYGLMSGYDASTFGYGDPMTRVQFLTVLDRMMGWSASVTASVAMWMIPFEDLEISNDLSETYLSAIEQALYHDVIDADQPLRPGDPITRGEMSEMLVRALGLKSAAEQLNNTGSTYASLFGTAPFTDLPAGEGGYITVAYTIGMTNGTSATTFSPDLTATRAQAAAMLVRIYEKLQQDTDFLHGFYAISSYSQLDLAKGMDAVSAGWSQMSWDGTAAILKTTSANGNEYAVPSGYEEVAGDLEKWNVPLHLSVFMEGQSLKDMLASEDGRTQAVEQIVQELTVDYQALGENPYDGVTIDFEGLRSGSKQDFTAFLTALSEELRAMDKTLYVCVPPVLATGSYYDGYDFAAIGVLADKVIVMAYNYDPTDMSSFVGTTYHQNAATAPLDQVFLSLRAITRQVDPEKVVLGYCVKNTAWQIDADGKLVSGTPVYPSNDTVAKRLAQTDTQTGWSDTYQQSYAIYTTEDGSRYFLWYQDDRSVEAAQNAARLLGVTGISIWRLGAIPQYTIGYQTWNWSGLLG